MCAVPSSWSFVRWKMVAKYLSPIYTRIALPSIPVFPTKTMESSAIVGPLSKKLASKRKIQRVHQQPLTSQ